MKKMNLKKLWYVPVLLATASFTACLDSGDETIVLEEGTISIAGIPSDDLADPNPEITTPTTTIPNVNYTFDWEGDNAILRLDMTGVQDPNSEDGWLNLVGTGGNGANTQNIWVSLDGKPKGIAVYNNSENEGNHVLLTDVVFLVDNSGSMSDEAEGIARDITTWAGTLSRSSLDVKFGCVGYGGNVGSQYATLTNNYGVTGALDMSDYTMLDNFLNNRSASGTSRTKGYAGSNATMLSSVANASYSRAGGECGVQALRFADENFTFRTGANRVYINFTDDANYPGGNSEISVDYVADVANWNTAKGTIHTVFSGGDISSRLSIGEKPWLLSDYTGGTSITVSSSFTEVTLDGLPVTGAMQNSYIIRFTNIRELMDGQPHEVKVTILSADKTVQAEKTFYIVFPEA